MAVSEDEAEGAMLDGVELSGDGQDGVADGFEERVVGSGHFEAAFGGAEEGFADRGAFGFIAVEESGAGSVGDGGEFPPEVGGILHAGVHALAADGRVDVRSVAGEEGVAGTVVLGLLVVDVEGGNPVGGADGDFDAGLVGGLLEVLDGEFAMGVGAGLGAGVGDLVGVEGDDEAGVFVVKAPHEDDVALVEMDREFVGGDVGALEFEVAEEER